MVLGAPHQSDDDVPRDGDDVLAGAGGGRDEGAGMRNRINYLRLAALRSARLLSREILPCRDYAAVRAARAHFNAGMISRVNSSTESRAASAGMPVTDRRQTRWLNPSSSRKRSSCRTQLSGSPRMMRSSASRSSVNSPGGRFTIGCGHLKYVCSNARMKGTPAIARASALLLATNM